MKCPECGAEASGKFCEYCGSELQKDAADIGRCPKCGSGNVTFKRERVGSVTRHTSRKNLIGPGRTGQSVNRFAYRTVGICHDCGSTWNPNAQSEKTRKSSGAGKKTWVWVLGWICIFPVPLTILLMRKKDLKPEIKYSLIAAAWLLFFAVGVFGSGISNASGTDADVQTENAADKVPEGEQTGNDG